MNVKVFPLGELQANCYLLETDSHCLLIDPADSADFLAETIVSKGYTLDGMLATHGHFDHVMATGELQMNFLVPLYIHEADHFLLDRIQTTAQHFLSASPAILPITKKKSIHEGALTIGIFSVQILETPGHTPGSICIYIPEEGILFSGDTLFYHAVGAWNHQYSQKELVQQSVKKILALPEGTRILPGHGEETTVDEEKENHTVAAFFS